MRMLRFEELKELGMSDDSIAECVNHYFDLLDSIGDTSDIQRMGFSEEDANDINWQRIRYSNEYWNKRNP